jgi:hypothetical protein
MQDVLWTNRNVLLGRQVLWGALMKLLLSCLTYLAMVTAGFANSCSTESFDFNAPGLSMGTLRQRVEAVFPTYRDLLLYR